MTEPEKINGHAPPTTEEITQQLICMHMDELKKLFVPGCKLTFIVRNPSDKININVLTEENDLVDLATSLKRYALENVNQPKPIPTYKPGNA